MHVFLYITVFHFHWMKLLSQADFRFKKTGCGKTELIKQFCNLLEYNMHTLYLYKDMSTRDLLQQRTTTSSGDTVWQNSPLVGACLAGDVIVLDGIQRLRDDTLMSLRRLIQDRELDLADGSKLLRHDKYDALVQEAGQGQLEGKVTGVPGWERKRKVLFHS